jgi:hypothetical protein
MFFYSRSKRNTPSVHFVCCLRKKSQIKKVYFYTLFFYYTLFFGIYYTLIIIHKKIPIFLDTLYLSKKLKPPKKLKADRNKPIFFSFKKKISVLTRYTLRVGQTSFKINSQHDINRINRIKFMHEIILMVTGL